MSNDIQWLIVLGAIFSVLALPVQGTVNALTIPPIRATQLQCDGFVDTLGVDRTPHLSWRIEADPLARGKAQSAFEIIVSSTGALLEKDHGDLWDSGRVASNQMQQIPYAGQTLRSSQCCFWKVRVWDEQGTPSDWSAPAEWTMGILLPDDWQNAKWIGLPQEPHDAGSLLVRRGFAIKRDLRRATIHVTGLGHYELTVNGQRIGDDLLSPGWTDYRKTILYDTYDLTPQLRAGDNAVGLFMGGGFYRAVGARDRYSKWKGSFGPLQAIALLRLEYADGRVESIVSDAAWRAHPGPVTFSDVYGGEDHDARLEQSGWNKPAFDDASWKTPTITQGPGGALRGISVAAPPIRAIETLKPISSQSIKPGVTVYDLGQNAAILPRLAVTGAAGARVKIVPSELVNASGDINDTMCHGQSFWTYTLAGRGPKEWFPRFFYRGARYLRVECIAPEAGGGLPVVTSIEGVVVQGAAAPVGEFSCSNDLFTRVRTLIRWAQRSNIASVLTDCPTREKLGWLEEAHLNGPALRYEWNLSNFFNKITHDMADGQRADGLIPSTCPDYPHWKDDFADSPEWGSAVVLVPWQQYQFEGDIDILDRNFDVMNRYVDYLHTRAKENLVDYGLGDWYDIGPKPPGRAQLTPRGLTATAFYQHTLVILAKAAALTGRQDEARRYGALADQVKAAFNAKYFDTTTKQYSTGSQCANSVPLVMDLVPADSRAAVLDHIVQDVKTKGLTAGDVGYRYLLRALADGGRSDVIYAMNNQSDHPGYGYQLARGATALAEAWDARPDSSQNHFMLGQINEWFYHDLAGIQFDAAEPGFAKIHIRPAIVGDLTWVRGSYASVHGKISVAWSRHGSRATLDVTIPANTTASIELPTKNSSTVTESGKAVATPMAVDGRSAVEIGSGTYQFAFDIVQLK